MASRYPLTDKGFISTKGLTGTELFDADAYNKAKREELAMEAKAEIEHKDYVDKVKGDFERKYGHPYDVRSKSKPTPGGAAAEKEIISAMTPEEQIEYRRRNYRKELDKADKRLNRASSRSKGRASSRPRPARAGGSGEGGARAGGTEDEDETEDNSGCAGCVGSLCPKWCFSRRGRTQRKRKNKNKNKNKRKHSQTTKRRRRQRTHKRKSKK